MGGQGNSSEVIMTLQELMNAIGAILPEATLGEDEDEE